MEQPYLSRDGEYVGTIKNAFIHLDVGVVTGLILILYLWNRNELPNILTQAQLLQYQLLHVTVADLQVHPRTILPLLSVFKTLFDSSNY